MTPLIAGKRAKGPPDQSSAGCVGCLSGLALLLAPIAAAAGLCDWESAAITCSISGLALGLSVAVVGSLKKAEAMKKWLSSPKPVIDSGLAERRLRIREICRILEQRRELVELGHAAPEVPLEDRKLLRPHEGWW